MTPNQKLQIIQASTSVINGKLVFNKEYAVQQGLPNEVITSLENYIAEQNSKENPNVEPLVAPIILWAAKLLGGFLAKKLLDMGASAFCNAYGDKNSTTKLVCDVLT